MILKIMLAFFVIFGFSFSFWSAIGALRFIWEKVAKKDKQKEFSFVSNDLISNQNFKSPVAVCMSAINEESVITHSILALKKIINPAHIYIANDGSVDKTSELITRKKCNVLNIFPNQGKANALDKLLKHFNIYEKYEYVLFVDADTRLRSDYLKNALPVFNDPEIGVVAGFARSQWKNNLYIAYRSRVWFLAQTFFRFGMSWKFTNVNMIISGFASIYRTSVLKNINITKTGLVIEDFNMTFELQKKKLGKIAFYPNITGYTQDPDNFKSYCQQIKRWNLGFWQTVKVNRIWPSSFWFSLSIYLFESYVGSLQFLMLPGLLIFATGIIFFSLFLPLTADLLLLAKFILNWFLFLFLFDYMFTILTALVRKKPSMLVYGLIMIFFRFIDAYYFLTTFSLAIDTKSTGVWESPKRWGLLPKVSVLKTPSD